ncbi:MAG TPA: DUF1361 domain-containing protein [Capsulimonadaceae bacterium]
MRPPLNVLWNIFLAVLPVVIAFAAAHFVRGARREGRSVKAWIIPVLLMWLALLPNTCYLLTEWRHYLDEITTKPTIVTGARHNPHMMLDFLMLTAFYAVYSGMGILTFFLAIAPIDRLVRPPRFVKPLFFILCSLGVYLGLIPRFNSWDFLHRPGAIFATIAEAFARPPLALLIVGFGIALWGLYFLFSLMIDGLELRLKADRASETS